MRGAATAAAGAHFSIVRSSTPPVRNRIWPAVVDLPASTWPMNTMLRCSLQWWMRHAGAASVSGISTAAAASGGCRGWQQAAGAGAGARPPAARGRSTGGSIRAGSIHHAGRTPRTSTTLLAALWASALAAFALSPAHRASSALISSSVFRTSACRASRCASLSTSTSSSPPLTASFLTSRAAASTGAGAGGAPAGAAAAGGGGAAAAGAGAGAAGGERAAGRRWGQPALRRLHAIAACNCVAVSKGRC